MNILFLTIGQINGICDHGIYADLLRYFSAHGHKIYVVSPNEKKTGLKTNLKVEMGVSTLHVAIGNITKCSIIEKGISTLQIEHKFKSAIERYYKDVTFDLILYSTPPITFSSIIQYFKHRDNAHTYLLLKDIFPQNAVDIGMIKKNGFTSIVYRYFRSVEKKLYAISDRIGCMSQANVDYLLVNNPEIAPDKVEICPNSIEIQDITLSAEERVKLREKYGLPQDKKIFVYGGNLGKPQGIPFIIECLKSQTNNPEAYFLIVGDGTEYEKLAVYLSEADLPNVKLMKMLPQEDYDYLAAACDVGLIFLDHRFTIPNFPSRLLAYMQAGLPVLACTDPNTDIGKVIVDGGFGWWCESNDVEAFGKAVHAAVLSDSDDMKQNSFLYLKKHYTVEQAYQTILKALGDMES